MKINGSSKRKRPPKAYMIFYMENKKIFIDSHPEMRNNQINYLISIKWKELPEELKNHYKLLAQEEMKKFNEENPQFVEIKKKEHCLIEKNDLPTQFLHSHQVATLNYFNTRNLPDNWDFLSPDEKTYYINTRNDIQLKTQSNLLDQKILNDILKRAEKYPVFSYTFGIMKIGSRIIICFPDHFSLLTRIPHIYTAFKNCGYTKTLPPDILKQVISQSENLFFQNQEILPKLIILQNVKSSDEVINKLMQHWGFKLVLGVPFSKLLSDFGITVEFKKKFITYLLQFLRFDDICRDIYRTRNEIRDEFFTMLSLKCHDSMINFVMKELMTKPLKLLPQFKDFQKCWCELVNIVFMNKFKYFIEVNQEPPNYQDTALQTKSINSINPNSSISYDNCAMPYQWTIGNGLAQNPKTASYNEQGNRLDLFPKQVPVNSPIIENDQNEQDMQNCSISSNSYNGNQFEPEQRSSDILFSDSDLIDYDFL